MSALLYIVRKSIKNGLKELLRKPGKLALYILLLVIVAGIIVISIVLKAQVEEPAPLFWLQGIVFLFISTVFVAIFIKGLSGGDAIFGMDDVNLLFVSPISSRKVLLYGLIRMAKTALIASFFILFQGATFANFGVGFSGVLITLAGFLLSIMASMTVSLLIYSLTNGNAARKRVVKCVGVLLFLPLVVFVVTRYVDTQNIFVSLEAAINSPFLRFVPVAGWTAGGVIAFIAGNAWAGAGLFGLNLLLCAIATGYILLTNPDYYEDVLVATETAYEKKRAMAEGNINTAMQSQKAVKISKTGIPGSGAAALFGKHMREDFRENRFGILTLPSVLIAVGAVIVAFFVRDLIIVMQILMWFQIMLIGTGRGLKETYSHYIYLIPESSFKKILWSNMEIMARTLLESVLIFGIGGALTGTPVVYILACILTYTLFSLLLLGVNYLLMRFSGANVSMGLLVLIYYLAVVLVMLPGIVAAIIAGVIIGGDFGYLFGVLVLAGWELTAGLGCFALSAGVLHNCDMAVLKTGK
jgi:hypothetical protein